MPVSRQAELLVRVAAYDRSLPARAQGTAKVLIVTNANDADSKSTAAQMESALKRFDKIAGLPAQVSTIAFAGGAKLAAACRASHIAIVYLTQGLASSIGEIATALEGVDVLSVASIGRLVEGGAVLGFDLVSGNPTLLVNLSQAKKQNVTLDAEVLHLMKVVK